MWCVSRGNPRRYSMPQMRKYSFPKLCDTVLLQHWKPAALYCHLFFLILPIFIEAVQTKLKTVPCMLAFLWIIASLVLRCFLSCPEVFARFRFVSFPSQDLRKSKSFLLPPYTLRRLWVRWRKNYFLFNLKCCLYLSLHKQLQSTYFHCGSSLRSGIRRFPFPSRIGHRA